MKDKCDFSLIDKMIKDLSNSPTAEVHVGFFDDGERHPRSKESAPVIAEMNNFGNESKNIPPRPFIRDANNRAELIMEDETVKSVNRWLQGKDSVEEVIFDLGMELYSQWHSVLERAPAMYRQNSPVTIRLKGFDAPLYETGWLLTQIKVKKGGIL